MRFAVSVVTWRQAAIRFPWSGRSRSNRARICRSTGISRSAHSIRFTPCSASLGSRTCPTGLIVAVSLGVTLQLLHAVEQLPAEAFVLASKVSVGGRLSINRFPEIELLNDRTRPQIEMPAHQLLQPRIGYLSRSRSEEHTSELQSRFDLVCRLLLEKKK